MNQYVYIDTAMYQYKQLLPDFTQVADWEENQHRGGCPAGE